MSGIRVARADERNYVDLNPPVGRMAMGRDVTSKESSSFGASIGLFEDCDMEWTVLYDEYIYILEGELNLETREGIHDLRPGDGIWLPEGTWMVYRAKYCKAVVIVHPVNWRELQGR